MPEEGFIGVPGALALGGREMLELGLMGDWPWECEESCRPGVPGRGVEGGPEVDIDGGTFI